MGDDIMHVTFLVVPGHGHINPTLGVVAELVKRGHRVTYPVPEMHAAAVQAAGAEPVLYESPLNQTWDPKKRFTGSFFASYQLGVLEESLVITPTLEKHLAGDPPDLIVYDRLMPFAARVLGYAWNRPLVAISPTLVSNEHFSLWEEFAKHGITKAADDDPAVVELRERFAAFAAEYGVPSDRADAMRETSTSGGDPMVVFVPERFQPAADTFDDRYTFVGPCLTDRPHQGDWQPSGEGPVLLISLGTAANDRPEFFRACAEAFAGTAWQVVMSIGTWVDPADLEPLPDNVAAHQHVPQMQVLRHAHAFVSHGGMSSTLEALYHGVPLVAVPQTPEQEVNAERVVELGLGTMLQPDNVTAEAIRDAVNELADDGATRARLAEMSRYIRAVDAAAVTADIMETHAGNRAPGGF